MQVKTLSREEYEVALEALGADIPVEQLPVWQDFESTVDGIADENLHGVHAAGDVVVGVAAHAGVAVEDDLAARHWAARDTCR